MTDKLVIVAARAPVPGRTKTRLGAEVGMDRAAALYEGFLTDIAHTLRPGAGSGYDFVWGVTPTIESFRAATRGLGLEGPGIGFLVQHGETFPDRLADLFDQGFTEGYRSIVVVASDCPMVSRETVLLAFDRLRTNDVVVGRSDDGGFNLVGQARSIDLMTGTPSSTPDAADAVVRRARTLRLRVAEIDAGFDVDVADDLPPLYDALAPDGRAAPATWKALPDLDLLGWCQDLLQCA